MSASWVSLTIDLPESEAEGLQALLHEIGARGLEVRDREASPPPGVRNPRPGEAIVVAYFEERAPAEDALGKVQNGFPGARAALEEVPAEDWSQSWKSLIRSVEIGPLWVGPPWLEPENAGGRELIIIEPKMAFGTGDHPTTSLCLEAIVSFLVEHPGASVLDVGTGTGVLAIAAKRLGAARVVALDNDPTSVELARENAEENGVAELAISGDPVEKIDGPFDLVVANIVANTLVDLAPPIAARVGRQLVLAGVLASQRERVESAYVAQGLVPAGVKSDGEWIRIDLRRP
ncbi:MAG TPA: 50S ribosomal protein L11 methyltransferase [Myxococcaceae bacterium]|nr:50S ribosomal protein L11 methyltransferase [Myxococcaceae bacterium]